MLLEQGSAPAIYMEDGKQVFGFTRRYMETDDNTAIDAALKLGAVKVGEPVVDEDAGGVVAPAGYESLKKPEIIAKAAEEGITINPNQSKPEMLAAVIKAKAEAAAGKR